MSRNLLFEIKKVAKKNKARIGAIHTKHGIITTPAFVAVGTQGSVKSIEPDELKNINIDILIVNTYHMMLKPKIEVIEKFGGLHQFIGWSKPIMTDSGGFQVFSLARSRLNFESPAILKIDDSGVTFRSHWDGELNFLNADKSIKLQNSLNSDIMVAFDDCTTYPATKAVAIKSMERTHLWASESFETHKKIKSKNALYGSIQGSVYKDLRIKSAQTIKSIDFDGFAIGGVAVGESKEKMSNVLSWVLPQLPDEKPRHLLGVGEIDDVFNLVKWGIDTFDCVMPTRLGRMGHLLLMKNELKNKDKKGQVTLDITKSIYKYDMGPVSRKCSCTLCANFSRAYLHHLFRVKELLAYKLATIHNLFFMTKLMAEIRGAISGSKLDVLEREYLE
ncbi:MAG: tRNA guanosine(34) transglycosylase Tgt [Patescibacteria group bacterium]|nr:tRNA guanosine(34) transglycosylase Tgt [Patescibacteria group bacterium]